MLRLPTSVILASTLAALLSSVPFSQAALSYTAGDLFLGFRQEGNTTADFVVNLGPSSNFLNRTTPYILTLSGLDPQLDAIFGNNWELDSTVTYALFSTTSAAGAGARTLTISAPTGETAPVRSFNQSGATSSIISLKDYYLSQPESGQVPNSSIGSPSDDFSFTTQVGRTFGSSNLGIVEASITGTLDLYRLQQAPNSTPIDGTLLGTFDYTSQNTFVFTPVPEPGSALLSLVGFGWLGFGRPLRRSRPALA